MIFKCNMCKELMPYLNTPGDEINDSLICLDCAKEVKETLDRIKRIKRDVHNLLANPN